MKDDADGESGPSMSSGDENDETENMDFIQSEARWATMDEGALNAYIDKSLEATLDAKTSRELEKFRDQMAAAASAVQVHLLSLLLMLVRLLALVMLELLVLLLILLVLYPSPNIIKVSTQLLLLLL